MNKKYRIGVMGSAFRGRRPPQSLVEKAKKVGEEIAKNNCILITGACMGLPDIAAKAASKKGGLILGFSPAANLKEHLNPPISYPKPSKNCILIYTGMGKEARNVLSIRSSDALIFIKGKAGTMTEFALAYHMGKIIGVLEGTGGVTDSIKEIAKIIDKNTGAKIVSDPNPEKLVKKIIRILKNDKTY